MFHVALSIMRDKVVRYQSTLSLLFKNHLITLASSGHKMARGRLWRQAGSSPVEENTAAMPCWAQRRLESQCTVSASSSSQDPGDIALPGLQPLPIAHSVSTRTHTMHSSEPTHTHEHSNGNTLKLALSHSIWHQQRIGLQKTWKWTALMTFKILY